ncbi:hypothetical protein D3C84_819530 [compost metagenome]
MLTNDELWAEHLGVGLAASGFEKGGSDCGNQAGYMANTPMSFQSFTLDDLNLIVTFDPEFYRRFMAATGVAKHLNLLDKQDRVTLFQAVLYGNGPFVPTMTADCDLPPFLTAPQKEYVSAWWVKSETGRQGCIEALNEDEARLIGAAIMGDPIDECDKLPYPAQPRLNAYQHPVHGVTPSFCYDPTSCKGRGCCPKNYSCTE